MFPPFPPFSLRGSLRGAFTLVELLTVIAIIGILAGILIPVTSKVRLKAQRMDSIANLRSLGMAVALFTNDNKDKLPGPLDNTQYAYRNGKQTQLSYWLAEHMGFPIKTNERIQILGHSRFFSQYGRTRTDLENYTAYVTNHKVYRGGVANESPWGWDKGDEHKRTPKPLHTVDNPTRAIAIMEIDQELLTDVGGQVGTKSPEKPIFDDGRAVLFFDWHVKVVPFSVKMGNNK
ncbi:prepilin-type N-terminal cleavage/methylation domain-containing protein [Geminisphaera colitermitum]|uniref:prepilin-type N-terminal cleavage/methylation domain-containing protein n=1 Tax=Geminisphaera colitermitum TaxID=1148786 RepID=UPI0001965519|nr:prepilin-type N-terminal cleavage/methylation domain-containing protein [Geminisphaera colitermitum]